MSRAHELNRLADRAIARHGLKGAAERVAHGIVEMYEHATGRTMASAERDAAFVMGLRWLAEGRNSTVHVSDETCRLAGLLRSARGPLGARDLTALAAIAGALP